MGNIEDIIKQNLDKQIECINIIKERNIEVIKNIFNILKKCRDRQSTIYIVGNGGSASTASHFTSDLLKTGILENENRFKVISLTDNIPVMLAWGNDESFDDIFVQQLMNFLKKDDVVIGISGSGNSKNVLNAIDFANKNNSTTISLTGNNGGKLANISKINLNISSKDMLTIESMHLVICHLLLTIIRNMGNPMFKY